MFYEKFDIKKAKKLLQSYMAYAVDAFIGCNNNYKNASEISRIALVAALE